jgi:hypothetical protein
VSKEYQRRSVRILEYQENYIGSNMEDIEEKDTHQLFPTNEIVIVRS